MGLYDADFHAWAEAQADAIRRRSVNEIDWENLLEEVENLGRSQRDRLRSHFIVLIAHLLKWQFQPDDRRGRSWWASIVEQRRQIARLVDASPSLKPGVAEQFELAYGAGLVWAVQETHVQVETDYPVAAPFTLEEALDPDWPPSLAAWEQEHGRR